jgi:uncharacterized protein YndB with AHSA1/START domain
MAKAIHWRLHTSSPPEQLYWFWTTDEGRERFWAERSRTEQNSILLTFPDGTVEKCEVLRSEPPLLIEFSYFGSVVTVKLQSDGRGGTDLTLINHEVPDAEYQEVHAGWLSVLLPLKASADFRVDLRNHDRTRTWQNGYVDQ